MSFRYTTAGESHGPQLSTIIEGVPSGLRLSATDINLDLTRRQLGFGRGGRMKIEADKAQITAGVRHGYTLGSPIALQIKNADWKNWSQVMSAESSMDPGPPVTVPRPGHADLAGTQKYGLNDIRSVLERASARETAARVAAGAVAKRLLEEFDIRIYSHVTGIGPVESTVKPDVAEEDFTSVDKSPVRCLDDRGTTRMVEAIKSAQEAGESLGGIFEVIAFGLMPGLGSYATGPDRLGGRLAGAVMSIPAIKGFEIGDGFALASRPGSQAHDEIFFDREHGYQRHTNHAGGLEGGMTTSEPLLIRACMKPIPTLTSPLHSVDITTGHEVDAHKERSDVCAVPAAAVVGEAMVATVLAGALLEKLGGDYLGDIKEAYLAYMRRLKESWPPESSS